jgi:hypothetical protein
MVEASRRRVDENGRAYAGSQCQIQSYVNQLPEALNKVVAQAFGTDFPTNCNVRWISPLAAENYVEYRDAGFLSALGFPQHTDALSGFWPTPGPCWDALARIEDGKGNPTACILVEAKSHVSEFYSNDTRAGAKSLQLITKSLGMAKNWFGVAEAKVWTGFPNPEKCLYQYTNRLAHLYFFRTTLGIPAFLVNVHFLGDPHFPTDIRAWRAAIGEIHKELGLHRMPRYSANVFLPAKGDARNGYAVADFGNDVSSTTGEGCVNSDETGARDFLATSRSWDSPQMNSSNPQTVLAVGAEGGTLAIVRQRNELGNWEYWCLRDETTMLDVLPEGDIGNGNDLFEQSPHVNTFVDALLRLDKYPWFRFVPLKVNAEFADLMPKPEEVGLPALPATPPEPLKTLPR